MLIRQVLEYRQLGREVHNLRQAPAEATTIPGMVGHSLAMQEVYKMSGRVADSDATVLITGESGSGKELVAHSIHEFSRSAGRLVKVNCAAIPENLLEAELFGHEHRAFTNAATRRIGRFEQAHGGTMFLDEIAELPVAVQATLLRAVQHRILERVRSNGSIATGLRLITATAQDLGAAVAAGRFREDLYYRLNVVHMHLPPLGHRVEDIPLLIQRFLNPSGRPVRIREEAPAMLLKHPCPGNVRELDNVITRAIVLAPGGVITPDSIQFTSIQFTDCASNPNSA